MGIYAGIKGATVMRDGEKTFVPHGELVPEFLKMSPHGLASRVKQGIVTVDWDEDDVLLHPGPPRVPIVRPGPPAAEDAVIGEGDISRMPISVDLDWWPVETHRGFTGHLVKPDDDSKFLCGRRAQQPDEMPDDIDMKSCASCRKKAGH